MSIATALETPGFMAPVELEYLARLAEKSMAIAEVGSWSGRSARAFAENTKGVLICTDTWADNAYGSAPAEQTCHPNWLWNAFSSNTSDLHNIVPWRMNSVEGAALAKWRRMTFDLIFLDAGHNYEDIAGDIRAWQPLLTENGILAGHDYVIHHPGVIQAVDELIPKFKVVGTIWSTEE